MIFKRFVAFLSSLFFFAAVSCNKEIASSSITETTSSLDITGLEVIFLDVGKADAIVLLNENSTILIDCGEKGDAKQIINLLEERDRKTIDYLILTHYDKDHVGGAGKVIKNLDVKNILGPDHKQQSEEMEKYLSALKEKELTPQLITEDISFSIDDLEITVDAPNKTNYGVNNDNDFSLVTKIVHGDNTLLFTGDAMEARLKEVMDIGDCDLLKIPYHGRKIANLPDFLDSVTPEYAVVCTAKEDFSGTVQKQMNKRGIKYYSTCFNGRITVVSDGKNIEISPEKGI